MDKMREVAVDKRLGISSMFTNAIFSKGLPGIMRPKANENDDDFKRVGASGVVALVDDESSGDLEVEADNAIKGSYQPP